MAVVRWLDESDYLPDYGMIVVRDTGYGESESSETEPTGLSELASGAVPGGTLATARNGWLWAGAGDRYQHVRLELHDGVPPDQLLGVADLLETPFRSRTGSIGLEALTGSDGAGSILRLGVAGCYRVRVARRSGPGRVADPDQLDGDRWLFQFWPVAEPPEPPRWLLRSQVPTGWWDGGWRSLLDFAAVEVLDVFGPDRCLTEPELDALGPTYGRGTGWLDEPLWLDPPEPIR